MLPSVTPVPEAEGTPSRPDDVSDDGEEAGTTRVGRSRRRFGLRRPDDDG